MGRKTPRAHPTGPPGGWRRDPSLLRNDLEAPSRAGIRRFATWRLACRPRGALHAALTGSGSVVFGLFGSRVRAIEACGLVRAAGGRAHLTQTLDAVACARLAAVARIN